MTDNNNQVSVTYTDSELRNLVEEYITQQKNEFTLKGVCSYILYWAVEDGNVAEENGLIENYDLQLRDQVRVKEIIDTVISDDRIENSTKGNY